MVYREGNKFFLSAKMVGGVGTISGTMNYTAARYIYLLDLDENFKETYLGGKITSDKFLSKVDEMFECEDFHKEIEKVKGQKGKLFKFTKTLRQLTRVYFTSCEEYRN